MEHKYTNYINEICEVNILNKENPLTNVMNNYIENFIK